MEDLIHAIYVSAAPTTLSEYDTVHFLTRARKVNRENDISGMMLYTHSRLLLLLEGEAGFVEIARSTIFSDKREYQMLLQESIAEREFPEWTLGFEAVESTEADRLLGKPLLSGATARAPGIDVESAKTLLSIMGRRRWQADRSGMFRAIRRSARPSTAP